MITAIAIVLSIPWMAWTSRMSGGGWPKLPAGLDQWLFALPYALLLAPLLGWWTVLPYVGAVIGKRAPNAPWLDLGRSDKWRETSLTPFIDWLHGRVSEKTYDFVGLMISGLAAVLAPALALLIVGEPAAACILVVSGALKASAYDTGWHWPDFNGYPEDINQPTEMGEALTGFFCGIGLLAAYISIQA